jgi:NAD(P)-dependent dehydrogenase (short-subunit alcohol dehydrogenase family)
MVVHNAGAGQSLDRCIAIHLMGAFNILVPTWDLMRDQAFGRIVLTTSASALWSRSFPTPAEKGPDDFGYGASKGGLLGLTNELAYFGKPFNINVNAIAPYGRTRMNVPSTGVDGTSGPVVGQFFEQADPDLVAPVVAWLLHEDCTVSHEVLAAGAGRVSRIFLAETNGIVDPDLTIEAVRDRWDAIEDRDAYRVYDNGHDALLRWAEDIKLDR